MQSRVTPLFPEMPTPREKAVDLGGGYWARGEEFIVRPGLLDTDTIDTPGVASRLLYSTILPRDESRYFQNSLEDLDQLTRHAAIVAQGIVVVNAMNRARLAQANVEISQWQNRSFQWNEERQVFNRRIRDLEFSQSSLESQLQGLTIRCEAAKSEARRWKEEAENQRRTYDEMSSSFACVREENARLQRELAVARKETALVCQEASRVEAERSRATQEAVRRSVRDYRLSNDCYSRKEAYAKCFTRYGFYLGRSYLESRRPGESFSEMVYPDAAAFVAPDWRQYEPDSMGIDEMVRQALQDDLSNLTGPWSLFVEGPGPTMQK